MYTLIPAPDSMIYRHWMARHAIEERPQVDMHSLLLTMRDLLPPTERLHWRLVCDQYDARAYPDWFVELHGNPNEYE